LFENITDKISNETQGLSFKSLENRLIAVKIDSDREEDYSDGFIKNEMDYFIYDLPFGLFMFLLFALLFHITRNNGVSVFFIKYSCYSILFVMLFEGNIEEFTFYLSG